MPFTKVMSTFVYINLDFIEVIDSNIGILTWFNIIYYFIP